MKILHVNVSAICDRFYLTFFDHIRELGVDQIVYCPFSKKENSRESIEKTLERYEKANIDLQLLSIKKKLYKVLYFTKIKKYSNAIFEQQKDSDINIIHAHSLYTDGGVAYLLSKRMNIPYIVAVRGADTTAFMKYTKHLKSYARKVLDSASKVVFISPDLKDLTLKYLYSKNDHPRFLENSIVIPNGVDDYWLDNKNTYSIDNSSGVVRIVQVGRLVKYKNTDKSINAVKMLMHKGVVSNLTIAGDGPEKKRLLKITKRKGVEQLVSFAGFIDDKKQLLSLYRNSDIFLLPSKGETFGISYIEAMTQGLPIIGLIGSGVSGYLSNKSVGVFIKKANPKDIAHAVLTCLKEREAMRNNSLAEVEAFHWDGIARLYKEIFEEVRRLVQ